MKRYLYDRFFQLEDSHWWFAGRRQIVLSQLEELSARGPLLDVGCGTGGTLANLNGLGPGLGVDPAPQAVRLCQRRGLEVSLASGFELPYRSESFQTVLALDVIEHVDDDVGLLRELRRVLPDDGLLFLTVPALPALWSGHDDANEHRRRYLRSGLEDVIRQAGFDIERLTYYNSLLLPLAYLRKLAQRSQNGGVHLEQLPAPINWALTGIFSSESFLLRHSDLPLGASLLAACRPTPSFPAIRPFGDVYRS